MGGCISLDSEVTGLDLWHGAKPFFVTICNENNQILYYEWNVNVKTREPIIPDEDIFSLRKMISDASQIIMHNSKFDVRALQTIILDLEWDWSKTHDTLAASHVLQSNQPKDLTTLTREYLHKNILRYEKKLEKTVKEATKIAKKYYPSWRIANRNLTEMPSAKQKVWKFDTWLPREVALKQGYLPNHYFYTDLATYANKDSECTFAIWHCMKYELEKRDLWKHYLFQMESVRIAYEMETRGLTFSQERQSRLSTKYHKTSTRLKRECVSIAEKLGYEITLPKKGMNDSLRKFFIEGLKLPPVYNKKKKQTFDKKEAMPYYLKILDQDSLAHKFIQCHVDKSNYDTSIAYMRDYLKYGIKETGSDTYLLHPNLNPVGSKTTRWTHKNPNSANISTQEDDEGRSLRFIFGPKEGREWWSFDAKNIERRIPDYESGEQSLIDLYEKSDEPPFYGSFHILMFSILWEDIWSDAIKKVGIKEAAEYCKKEHKQVYKRTKNFDFAVQYGSGEANADLTAGKQGAFRLMGQRLTKLNILNKNLIAFAQKNGYVETLPLRNVGWDKGYPLLCTKTESGSILTTVPLSYHVQGSAMLLTCNGMHKVDEQLREWRNHGWDAFITMQIHDEIVIDAPRQANPKENPRQSNLGRMRVIQQILESGGDDFVPSIPTPFGCEFHSEHWHKGVAF